ncbi:MAG: peptidoglycan recognition family protein [Bacteroidota bacterium]
MPSSSSRWSLNIFQAILLIYILSCQAKEKKASTIDQVIQDPISVDTIDILSANKLTLTEAYSLRHYGEETYRITPKIVVVHHTVIPTLEETITLFKNDNLADDRTDINKHSSLNVGIHYVIDKDGSIFHLMPDTIMARHIIGFNHVSIGIENVARNSEEITNEQLQSNAKLIHYLTDKHPTLQYLIGHDEYTNSTYPHWDLYLELDSSYLPHDKPDPGMKFMADLREKLSTEHGVVLEK